METLGQLFVWCIDFMKTSFDMFGFEVSYWALFLLAGVGEVVALLIGGFIGGK